MPSGKSQGTFSGRSFAWWILCGPGALVMWFEYMFPRSVTGSFGTARRRNAVFLQFVGTMFIYAALAFSLTHLALTERWFNLLVYPIIELFAAAIKQLGAA
jgi:hypothetical protein